MTTAAALGKPPDLATYPRLRYMGSKYRLVPDLQRIFAKLDFDSALDAFSGSGVVAYAMKGAGKRVVANDFLHFPATVAAATTANSTETLSRRDVARITGPAADGRDFIRSTFAGLYFPDEDLAFLDSAWSHVDRMKGGKRDLAIAALCLAAARKQPRGVFTFTGFRYDDGRRSLRMPLRELFAEAVDDYNAAVFDNGRACEATNLDVFDVPPGGFDLVYLDPPYAPPRDDNCYVKRYHFLEGLSLYWQGVEIMENTATRKIRKRFTPFSYKRTVSRALEDLFDRFRDSILVLSYGSNSVPSAEEIEGLLRRAGRRPRVLEIDHRYSFGTHDQAQRRQATEYVFVCTR
ncbi:MAG: DNA adenine methylase [Frankiaceae bacterium]